jgi:hypothetical protein
MPDMVFKNLLIVGGTNSVETWGSNIDGLAFYGLFTQNSEVAIRCHGMQNLLVNGGGHSNCYDNFIYLQVDGGSVSGVLTLENLRIEQGVTLAWLGSATGNDQKNVDLVVRDVYYPSCRSGVSKTMLIHYGDVGAVTVENSWFLANGCYFHFEDMRTNEYASFNLKNCGLMNSNPEAYDSIVDVSCAGGAGSTGGVNVSMEGNYVMGGTWYNPTSRIVDKSFIVTPANAIAHTETWLLTKDLALVQSARFAGNGVQAVPVGATTVDTSLGNVFATANTAATTITSFINGIASQHVVLLIKDAHTTIQFNGSGNLITIGTSSWTPGTGHWLTADFDGTKWYCTRN